MARDEHCARDSGGRHRNSTNAEQPGGNKSGPVARALKRGRSGYGAESVRPHLRDQLVLKDLLRDSFPAYGPPGKDGDDEPE